MDEVYTRQTKLSFMCRGFVIDYPHKSFNNAVAKQWHLDEQLRVNHANQMCFTLNFTSAKFVAISTFMNDFVKKNGILCRKRIPSGTPPPPPPPPKQMKTLLSFYCL